MATLKNITVSDTGYFRLPQGTSGQRPTVPTITLGGFNRPLSTAHDGLQLWISSGASQWNIYVGLPDYLKGLQCTTSINDSDSTTFSCSHATRVYLMRQPSWNAVDLTGFTLYESGKNYLIGGESMSVYYRDYSAGGPYTIDSNSAMYLFSPVAAGTTVALGTLRFNTDTNTNEVWNGSEWFPLNLSVGNSTGGSVNGAGGTGVATIGGYKIHTFTSGGTFTPQYTGNVDVLVIGGGGCGAGLSGGGGAGGMLYQSNVPVIGGLAYPVGVGAGGPGPSSHSPGSGATGGQGGNSHFGPTSTGAGIVATGGGHGGYWTGPGTNGGSGGGGPGYNYNNGQRAGHDGIVGQGHPGGYGHHGSGPAQSLSPQPGICVYGGGGGGGAGERGHARFSWRAEAKGGDGMASAIAGTGATYYAGGGGGGVHAPSGNYGRDPATGGLGGGGTSYSGGPQAAHDGRANTGSGGAGAYHPDAYRSGNGGTGIVIVRYRT